MTNNKSNASRLKFSRNHPIKKAYLAPLKAEITLILI